MSGFRQVRLKFPKTPFFVHFDAEFGSSFGRIVSELPTNHPERRQTICSALAQ
jgi:hypothetical protein